MRTMKRVTYCPIGKPQRQFGVYLTGAGFERTEAGEDYPHEYHSSDYYFTWKNGRTLPDWEYQILYIRSGRGVIEFTRKKPIPLSGGSLVILRPGEWHRYRPIKEIGWEEAYIGIGGEMMENITRPPFFVSRQTVLTVTDREKFESSLYALIEKIKSSSAESPYSLALGTLLLLTTLFERNPDVNAVSGHNADIRKSTFHIAHHLDEIIDFAMLAHSYGMGYSLFRKRFREYTGLAPLEYQTSLRIRRACHLLSSSDLPIAQIATETGFNTPAYFARYFRKRLNMSPSEYRMAHKDSSDLQTIRPSGHQ